ncbi:MAG TPA: hypothetical protein VI643_05615, partial [Planctomycetota bacterium]|nr:hypothetical protein [Planctomycetota bacterium]
MSVALILALLAPQDDLDKLVERIDKAYAPIRSIVCQFEIDFGETEMALYFGSMRRIQQLRVVRGRYQANDVFMTMQMPGAGNYIVLTSLVRQGDRVFEKAFYGGAGEQHFVTAKRIPAAQAQGASLISIMLSEIGGSDLGIVSHALNPRSLLDRRESIKVGRETVEGKTYDTLSLESRSAYVEYEAKHFIDAETGRFEFADLQMGGERLRVKIAERQDVAGVPFPKTFEFESTGGRERPFGGIAKSVKVRVVEANSDRIPAELPAWTSDPALPDHDPAPNPDALLKEAKEKPEDAALQLRALNAFTIGVFSGDREDLGSFKDLIERLQNSKSDSPLVNELAASLLLASAKNEEFDRRVAAADARGSRSAGLAVLRLKSLFDRDETDAALKAFEACQSDPFAKACAADYELPLRVRAAPDAAGVVTVVAERTRGLDWA